jgi:hypothetical protein
MLQEFKTKIEPLNDELGEALGIRKIVVRDGNLTQEDGPAGVYDIYVQVIKQDDSVVIPF